MLRVPHIRPTLSLSVIAADSLPILRVLILFLICVLAFIVRLFAVIRFESVIHEFDPYFNFRTTRFLAKQGIISISKCNVCWNLPQMNRLRL